MSENNREKNQSNNKPDTFRLIAYGLGAAIVLICAIILLTIFVKKFEENKEQESAGMEYESAQELVSIGLEAIGDGVGNAGDGAEEMSTINAAREALVANWETIPAGTVIATEEIDFNNLTPYFVTYEISDEVYNYINEKSYCENEDVSLSDLRYMKLLHYNFEHELQVGELIVAAELESDFIGIFTELFEAEYEIQSMYLPDRYWTGNPTDTDTASIDVNNSSCFMYRPVTGGSKLSMHSYGWAIDINPQQNPYVSYRTGSPVWDHENANDYIDRTTGLAHMITEEDVCYQIFIKYGFEWGGSWEYIKDYQHFEK